MTKNEIKGVWLTAIGVIVAVLAWLFPEQGSHNIFIELDAPRSSPPPDVSPMPRGAKPEALPDVQQLGQVRAGADRPVVDTVSVRAFLNQLRVSGLDSGKVAYIKDAVYLLERDFQFSEALAVLQMFSLDSNKLRAMELIRRHVGEPTDEQLKKYAAEFSLASNRRKAFGLLTRR